MKAQPLYSLSFTADLSNLSDAFKNGCVVAELGNNSGLGVNNTWCEIRTEPTCLALGYHVFVDAAVAAQYCEDFGTVSDVSPEAVRRWNHLMRGVA